MSHLFIPRDWQERFVRQYQANPQKNTLVEGCTASGKTGGALHTFNSLKTTLDWKFVIAVTPSEHLRKQYAQDAQNLFGLVLYYSGTDSRLKTLPTPEDLLKHSYDGLVVSYQWLATGRNAQNLANALGKSVKGRVFVILDEVHHASEKLSFGQACEKAFPDDVVAHRLMTSGTPFRSDNNRILGNWLTYEQIDESAYKCHPDFRYTLADALRDQVIPPFSFVTLEGEFKYIRNRAEYQGQTFTNAKTDQQLRDALNTAIFVDGDWVKEAILWAYNRMKRDRAKGLCECATYVRVPSISAARAMRERIRNLTGEDALVVVSKEDDPNSNTNFSSKDNSSKLIEDFAAETGAGTRSWIVGVNMLGEGVSINRLKYRIHATNICAPLSFMQDLGRLLRLFPSQDTPEAVETLIPAHPTLIQLATDVLNEVAHVVNEIEEIDDKNDDSKGNNTDEREGESDISSTSNFIPLASTGEMGAQIVDGEEITPEYANVAEWVLENDPFFKDWPKTPAHLAQKFISDPSFFDIFHQKYREAVNLKSSPNASTTDQDIPLGFPSEYATWLPDEKADYVRKQVNSKVYRLACLLYPKANSEKRKVNIKNIHNQAKLKNGFRLNCFIGYQGWEKIDKWLLERIAHAQDLKGTEDL
ncbi:MAG: DEAD/DEAH box helicase family protein [Microcoleaceae cyanobacterium]